jgi:uncharacterized protein YqjF (DUF2071 family)
MDAAAPSYGPLCDEPVARAAMVHWWDDLTFIHWRYPPDAVARLLPPGLEVDTFDGAAWVGLVPFFLRVGLPGVASAPWLSRFAETNVRTYVRAVGRPDRRGIWFFSLDAARLGAVVTARATYRLPYFWSRMRIVHDGPRIAYASRRRGPDPGRGAASRATIELGARFEAHELGERDHFLTARWTLFSAPRSGLHDARAFHDPWPLYRARLVDLHDELVPAAGLPRPEGEPLLHYSPSVEVRIGWPHHV